MYQKVELAALASMPDADIDMSDIPDTKVFPNPRRGVFSDSPNRKVGGSQLPNSEACEGLCGQVRRRPWEAWRRHLPGDDAARVLDRLTQRGNPAETVNNYRHSIQRLRSPM